MPVGNSTFAIFKLDFSPAYKMCFFMPKISPTEGDLEVMNKEFVYTFVKLIWSYHLQTLLSTAHQSCNKMLCFKRPTQDYKLNGSKRSESENKILVVCTFWS